jgi:YegS/Rv2252/BmrU family lipid kinase
VNEVLIFANPIAGKGKGRVLADRIAMRLTHEGHRTRVFFDKAEGLGDDALCALPGVKAVVAIGGDGTLRGVVGRVVKGCGDGTPLPPTVVVPMGTANLMGQHLGLKWGERTVGEEVAAVIAGNKVVQLDGAVANGKLFLLMAGVGIDATVVHELDRVRRGPISMVSYALPAALALKDYRYPAITVEVDGERVFGGRPGIAMVGNIREYGTGFAVLPHARPDDGLLDVCAMPCASPPELVELFLHAAVGEHTKMEGVVYVKGKKVRITSPKRVPVQVDGDAAGFTPLEVELMARRVPFLVR